MKTNYVCKEDLIASERIVMIYLSSNSKDNSIQVRVEDLARNLSIGDGTIKRVLSSLVDKGYISRRRLGQGHPNIYTILK